MRSTMKRSYKHPQRVALIALDLNGTILEKEGQTNR